MNEFGAITRLAVKHARDAFVGDEAIAEEWRRLNFTAPPNFARASAEYERFLELLTRSGAAVYTMPRGNGVGLDSIYVRDASIVGPRGVILCRMGKPQRAGEPAAQAEAFRSSGVSIAGQIEAPGCLEGGDVMWLDARTIVVGRGYRTNDEGIRQLQRLLDGQVDDVIVVPLPHWRGQADVFHLMSIISPVDRDLAVAYSPLMPVPFREGLLDRGISLVEVPDDEFASMGANVLAIAPRQCVMVAGNPKTRALLERAGAEVFEYEGAEISVKGGGGPTCLTRPLERAGAAIGD